MKVLITGSSGMLGAEIFKRVSEAGWIGDSFDRRKIDFSRPLDLVAKLNQYDILIHAAANTNVEACEADPVACYRDNTLLTETLLRATIESHARMVFISSTGVYGEHCDVPYHEYDLTHPTTEHHRSKLAAEHAVLRDARTLVVRTGWLFGGRRDNPKNFVARRREEALASTTELSSNSSQKGCPTYAADVASRLLKLIEIGCSGVFNCVNTGTASRFDYVKAIVEFCNIDVPVKPTSGDGFQRRAKVSNNEMALNMKQDLMGLPPLRNWREALEEYIRNELDC